MTKRQWLENNDIIISNPDFDLSSEATSEWIEDLIEDLGINPMVKSMSNEYYRWHDLQKNPDDLPESYTKVDVFVLNDNMNNQRLYAEYDIDGWYEISCYPHHLGLITSKVIKWKYIDPFEQ